MKEKTVIILGEGKQLVLEGKVRVESFVGLQAVESEITEVVDDTVVYCYTVKGMEE